MREPSPGLVNQIDIHPSAYVFPNTFLAGTIRIGAESSVWPMSVLRADTVPIQIGASTNVQDGCIIHGDPGFPVHIGDWVTLGHGAIIHGAVIEDEVLIGIGAVILNGARIGHGSVVGARALVTEGMQVPPGSLVLGVPGRIRQLSPEQAAQVRVSAEHYVARKELYRPHSSVAGRGEDMMPLPPLIGIVMGSDSDLPTLQGALDICGEFRIPYEVRVVSAHRTPLDMIAYGQTAHERGLRVIIAGAGGAAHLPGMLAACSPLPVIGVPVLSKALNGIDSLLSIVQMPAGVPVATVAIGGGRNAGLLAVQILAISDPDLFARMLAYKALLAEQSRAKNATLNADEAP